MRVLPFLFLALTLGACSGKKACRINSDCPEVERCVANECTIVCRTDRDCATYETCFVGECVLRGGPCGADGFCDVHGVFFEGQEALRGHFARSMLSDLAGPATGEALRTHPEG